MLGINDKLEALDARLRALRCVLIAYSGGVDSAFLADRAFHLLGDRVLAVLADSPSLARSQRHDAVAFARERGIPLRIIETAELANPDYARNGADRCFFCKDELFTVMEVLRDETGFAAVAYGMNTDDYGDFRPGQRAAVLHHVAAPLLEAGLGKADVRELSRRAGLRVWDKPASACLSSRVAYGLEVTRENLLMIERAEEVLRRLDFRVFRVRYHGEVARLEIARDEMHKVFVNGTSERIVSELKTLGFRFVTLDLEGFRSGSMNSVLPLAELRGAR
jgi:uncharacterized protein